MARSDAQRATQDPEYRKKLLEEINTPYAPEEPHPINPFTDFHKWWDRYKENVNEPVREAWEDSTWFGPAHKALSIVTYPFNVISSAATTTAGFEKAPMVTDAFSQYAANHNYTTLGGYLAIMAGMGLDVLADPLNLISMGPKAAYTGAKEVLSRAPSLRGIGELDKALEVSTRFKQSRQVTPEAIEKIAAPQMAMENVSAALGADAQKNPLFTEIASATHGPGAAQYQQLVDAAKREKNLEEFATLPDNFADPLPADPTAKVTALAGKLSDLAKHQVQIGREAWEARPVLRVFGRPVGIAGYRIPSLWEGFSNLASKAAGLWEKQKLPPMVLQEANSQAATELRPFVESILQRPLDDREWQRFAIHDLDSFIQQSQATIRQNAPSGFRSVAENSNRMPGLLVRPDSVRDWVYAYIKRLDNPANQTRMVQQMLTSYEVLGDAIRAEPKAAWSVNAQQVEAAQQTLRDILDDGVEQFVENQNKRYFKTDLDPATNTTVLRRDAAGELIPKTRTRRYTTASGEEIKETVPVARPETVMEVSKRLTDGVNGLQASLERAAGTSAAPGLTDLLSNPASLSMSPQEFSDILAQSVGAQRMDFPGIRPNESQSIVSQISQIQKDYDTLTRTSRSYPYDVIDAMSRKNIASTMDGIQEISNNLKMFVDDYFVGAERSVTGVEMLGKMLNTKGGDKVFRDLWRGITEPAGGGMQRYSAAAGGGAMDRTLLSPVERANAQSEITRRVEELVRQNVLSTAERDTIAEFLNQQTNASMGQFLYGMANLAETKLKTNVRARVMSAMSAPYQAMLEKAEAMIRTTYADELKSIFDIYGRYQDRFSPRQLFEFAYKPGGLMSKIDALHEKVFRTLKFGPNVHNALEALDSEKLRADLLGEEYGRAFSENNVLRAAENANPRFAGGKITGAQEAELNEAYGQIVSNRQSINYSSPAWDKTIGEINGGTWSEHVRSIANREVTEGYRRLEKLLGDRAAADRFINGVDHASGYREMFKQESKKGMVGVSRREYLNYKLTGNGHDYDRWLDHMHEAENAFDNNAALAVRTFGHGERRRFLDVAEVMAYIDKINLDRQAANKLPLNLKPVYNISSLIGERYHNHLMGIANRKALYELAALLPEHVNIFSRTPKSGRWKDIGELIPSFKNQGWFVDNRMYDYLQTFIPVANREKTMWDMFAKFNQYITRLSTNFSLIHLKNQIALATLAEMDPARFGKWVKYMWENRNMSSRFSGSPIQRMKNAIESHPMYQEAISNGLTHFRGDASFRSTAENIAEAMNPSLTWWEKASGFRKSQRTIAASPQGPFSAFVFDIVDRGMKMALYEEYRMKGLTPRAAANLANHKMIDYSARMLNPKFKQAGYTLFPFFSWHVGNALLHIPNILQNPRMYSLIKTAERFMNNAYSPYAGFPPDMIPTLLANAVASPDVDSHGAQHFWRPELPGDAHLNLIKNVMKNPLNPFTTSDEVARFVLTRSRYAQIMRSAFSSSERKKLENQSVFETMFGDMDRPGYVDETLWGLVPMKDFVRLGIEAMVNPDAWSDAKYIGLNMFMRNQGFGPDGKPTKNEQYKQVLLNKFGGE